MIGTLISTETRTSVHDPGKGDYPTHLIKEVSERPVSYRFGGRSDAVETKKIREPDGSPDCWHISNSIPSPKERPRAKEPTSDL